MKKVMLLFSVILLGCCLSSCANSRKGGSWYRNRNNTFQPQQSPLPMPDTYCSLNTKEEC